MNHFISQYKVAVCFEDGIGTTKDPKKVIEWFSKAAENGDDRAKEKLGIETE